VRENHEITDPRSAPVPLSMLYWQLDKHAADSEAPYDLPAGLQRLTAWMAETVQDVTVRVFLLDGHEVVRCGLRDLLEHSGNLQVVGEASRANEALRQILAVRPHVAVLDARLPDGSGLDVCREIRSLMPSVACLILTSSHDDETLLAAITAGASGYLLKQQIRGTDLINAVHRVAQGQSLLDPAVTAPVLTRLHEDPPATDPRWEALSHRERAILALIADGLSNRQIGTRLRLAEKTVKNYVSRLLTKLQMKQRTQLAVFGRTVPYSGSPTAEAAASNEE
jgi:two-component system, NarL family, response regulator DevR